MNTYIFKVAVFTKQAKSEYNSRILFLVPRIPHLGLQLGLSPIFVLAVNTDCECCARTSLLLIFNLIYNDMFQLIYN